MIGKANSDQRAEVVVVRKESMRVNELLMDPLVKSMSKRDVRPPPTPGRRNPNATLSWNINEPVRVTIHKAWNVNVINTNVRNRNELI